MKLIDILLVHTTDDLNACARQMRLGWLPSRKADLVGAIINHIMNQPDEWLPRLQRVELMALSELAHAADGIALAQLQTRFCCVDAA